MTLWALVAIVLLNGQPVKDVKFFEKQNQCEAAKAVATKNIVAAGAQEGGLVCVPIQVGKFS